jgi:hypothetical protein
MINLSTVLNAADLDNAAAACARAFMRVARAGSNLPA